MKIAIEGCAHGELDIIYDCLQTLKRESNIDVDLLICCGDFQSVRNNEDLSAMAVPDKYKNICSFYKYYNCEKIAPVLTIFIGGNHEASNYLQELPYGGWVAPNIFYLGRAGVVQFGDVRIGGLSGIFKAPDYYRGLWECPPYTDKALRSVYHIRALDVMRLKQMKEPVDVMLSHDWPTGITDYGNKAQLLRKKPYFKEDIDNNSLGSPPAEELLNVLKPEYWFSAHLHCQFAAVVSHVAEKKETKFLALDKCLPRRRHLQILDINGKDGDKKLKYDSEWLAILRSTNHLLSTKDVDCFLPGPGGNERYEFTPTEEEKILIIKQFGNLEIPPENFVKTAPDYEANAPKERPKHPYKNPQTENLCSILGIDDPLQLILARCGKDFGQSLNNSLNTLNIASTPFKCSKMVLPTPTTPIVQDFTDVVSISDSMGTADASLALSEEKSNVNVKKTFKRRNESMYVSNVDEMIESSMSDVSADIEKDIMFKKRNSSIYDDPQCE